jgi:alkylation response protein AidB-like acyl-CoA dehydrogenase
MSYAAPLVEMRFTLREVAGLRTIRTRAGYADASDELVDAVLGEAGRFAVEVLAPLNAVGDRHGCALDQGEVRTPPGFAATFRQFAAGGWIGLDLEAGWGGQGLPCLVATAVADLWTSANMAFAICPMLTRAAAELLGRHGSPPMQQRYLPRMVAGEWTGTMDLTEPQAGSDLSLVRTRAERGGDHYRLYGQKIYITYGEHDLASNIVHFVLARTAPASAGSSGLSLFLAPKYVAAADGSMGARNDIRCIGLERKLGIHGSPTTALVFGETGGAVAYLLGDEGRGLDQMFTMMNRARLEVGLQGVGIAERAYQQARAYAFERVQGRPIGSTDRAPAVIARHADVQRMLLTMRSATEAARALAYFVAAETDLARNHSDATTRRHHRQAVDLLTPVVKAWPTAIGIKVADAAIQVYGGLGYIEDSGMPQYLRDGRIAAIYEGTNGIQAIDLVGRKLARDGGEGMRAMIARMRDTEPDLKRSSDDRLLCIRRRLHDGLNDLEDASTAILDALARQPGPAIAGAPAYLELAAVVVAGWLMARAAIAAKRLAGDPGFAAGFLEAKVISSLAFAELWLSRSGMLREACIATGALMAGIEPDRDL